MGEKKGKFIFEGIQEGEGEGKRIIKFNPSLVIEYSIYNKIDKETGVENFPDDVDIKGFATFDFGMNIETSLDARHNSLLNGYLGLTPDSELEDIFMKTIMYDLFHAFFHIPQDPNYNHYHWALYGWLKERADAQEFN